MGGNPVDQTFVQITLLHPDAKAPVYRTGEAAGADLCSIEDMIIPPGRHALVRTGIRLELQPGTEAQVRSRSGLALKDEVHVLNSPGTIDSDYRGEVQIILRNSGRNPFVLEKGMRIAQLVIAPVLRGVFTETQQMSATERGEGGFGSTGA